MVKTLLISLFGGFFCLNGISPIPFFTEPQPKESRCDLPGPKNVDVAVSGPSYFDVVWDPVPEAAFFYVSIYDSTTDSLTGAAMVPALKANNHAVVDGLIPGNSYYIYVNSVCSNGIASPKLF